METCTRSNGINQVYKADFQLTFSQNYTHIAAAINDLFSEILLSISKKSTSFENCWATSTSTHRQAVPGPRRYTFYDTPNERSFQSVILLIVTLDYANIDTMMLIDPIYHNVSCTHAGCFVLAVQYGIFTIRTYKVKWIYGQFELYRLHRYKGRHTETPVCFPALNAVVVLNVLCVLSVTCTGI